MRAPRLLAIASAALLGGSAIAEAASPVIGFPSQMSALAGIYNALVAGLTVSGTMNTSPSGVAITQTTITLPAGQDTILVADVSTTPRKHIELLNIDTGEAYLAFGGAATAGQGQPLDPAPASGEQGGGYTWDGMTVPSNAIHAISSAGTRIVVTIGN